jgi:hypothetical protein
MLLFFFFVPSCEKIIFILAFCFTFSAISAPLRDNFFPQILPFLLPHLTGFCMLRSPCDRLLRLNPKGVAQQSPGLVRGTSAYPGYGPQIHPNPERVAQRGLRRQPLAIPWATPLGLGGGVGGTQGRLALLANPGLCWETPLGLRCSLQTPSKILSTPWDNCVFFSVYFLYVCGGEFADGENFEAAA